MTVRIAMWSGPRNISTAMMRAWGNRPDCAVSDEPFYAAYLHATGLDHPMRAAVLAAQPTDWRAVAAALAGPAPAAVWYQKHMCQHMLPAVGLDWAAAYAHAFLVRPPEQVLASYAARRAQPTADDIGFRRQAELFDHFAQRQGRAPAVVEAGAVLADPAATLAALCAALGVPFSDAMLAWPAGRRDSDGVWAPAWYDAVERSTAFAAPGRTVTTADLPDALRRVADEARPFYERLLPYRIGGQPTANSRSSSP